MSFSLLAFTTVTSRSHCHLMISNSKSQNVVNIITGFNNNNIKKPLPHPVSAGRTRTPPYFQRDERLVWLEADPSVSTCGCSWLTLSKPQAAWPASMTCSHSMVEVGDVTLQLYYCAAFSALPTTTYQRKKYAVYQFRISRFLYQRDFYTERVVLNAYGVVTDLR